MRAVPSMAVAIAGAVGAVAVVLDGRPLLAVGIGLVAALAAASPPGERVISIEEVAELSISRDEWIQLETRPGNGQPKAGSIDMATLLETAPGVTVGQVREATEAELAVSERVCTMAL